MPTQLTYAIRTMPNPLTAEATDASITLLATNETDSAVSIEGLIISIPIGTEADDLTNLPNQIVVDYPKGWKESPPNISEPGVYKIIFVPKSGTIPVAPHSSLTFVLNKIAINGADGTVDLSITEGSASQPTKVIPVSKFPKGWGSIVFNATPPDMRSAGDVTLNWNGPAGATYTIEYLDPATQQVVPIPAPGGPALSNSGNYPGTNDPALHISATTVFTLTVTKTIAGHKFKYQPQQTVSVGIAPPSITCFSGQITGAGSNRKLLLTWKTENADYVDASWANGANQNANPSNPITIPLPFTSKYTISAVAKGGAKSEPANVELSWINQSTISVGIGPSVIAITPDGKSALVTNYYGNTVSVIDLNTLTVKSPAISIGNVPSAIAITPDGKSALVGNVMDKTVSVIDLSTLTVKSPPIRFESSPTAIAITPDGTSALVTMFGDIVPVIDLSTLTVKSPPIAFGDEPQAIAITPDGASALVANSENTVSVIDLGTLTVKSPAISVGNYPTAIAITPDGTSALVTMFGDIVPVIDLSTLTVKSLPISLRNIYPMAIAITPDGTSALVANQEDHSVWVIDLSTLTVKSPPISVGNNPKAIAITPDGTYALVGNFGDNTVSVIGFGTPLSFSTKPCPKTSATLQDIDADD
ncbi:MAG: YncE family protein [Bacteroidota bacterium]